MKNLQITMEARTLKAAKYIVEKRCMLRQAQKALGIPKSTIHADINNRLVFINPNLYGKVREILDKNLEERHIRGGMAVKKKYQMGNKLNNLTIDTSGSMGKC